MKLIADSGSTKADWFIIDKQLNKVGEVNSKGFNPLFHDENFILTELHERIRLKKIAEDVSEIYFYGASCSSPERCAVLEEAFRNFFVNIKKIEIGHDLKGAVYATTPDEPGLVSILGTGSNACYYDGMNINRARPSLGFILGDEGSGASFGKALLTQYLYGQVPKHLSTQLTEDYELSKDRILESVYMKANPNVYLASFARFLSDNKEDPFVHDLTYHGLEQFVETHLCVYPEHKELKAHFIGSISYFYEDTLREVCANYEIEVGHIIQRPIERLVDYHLRQAKLQA